MTRNFKLLLALENMGINKANILHFKVITCQRDISIFHTQLSQLDSPCREHCFEKKFDHQLCFCMTHKKRLSMLPVPLSARQVAKNTPKRIPSVTMHSPSGCSSPSQEFSPGDQLECLTLDLTSTKNVSL